MKPRRHIEREFGVPIAGEILDQSLWTSTALKKLPQAGPLSWESIFNRRAPVVLDLGCGNGRFLIGSAVWRPDHDHLGCDILPLVLRYATRRANQRGLANIRFAAIDGFRLLDEHVAPASVQEIHCYHPQPFYDPRDVSRRLVTPAFLVRVHRSLAAGGKFFIQTDNPGYWRYIEEVLPVFFDVHRQERPWPDAPKGRTRREIIALRRRLPVFRAWAMPRPELDVEQALRLAEALPLPTFDADRALREVDEMEQAHG
ncbi:MAG: methyltransferase domain-containing protein [Planctomycetes bacterium]|nr:methyltransferase domain-containing protein [Planctomycetota bacterium]